MTIICCAHGCRSNSDKNPALKFYNLATARGSLSEWLKAFPFRYRLNILAEVKSGNESPHNICEIHFNQKAPEPIAVTERITRDTQTNKSYISMLKQSPVEIVDIQPEPAVIAPAVVNNNVKMQPIINSNAPVFLGGVQPCYTDTGAFGGFIANVDVQPNPPLITSAMVNNNVVMQPVIRSHVPAFFGGAQPGNRDFGTIGGLVANMNAVQQTQCNTAEYITINIHGAQVQTNNVASKNTVQTQCTNTARLATNAAQPRTDNLINTGFRVDSPGGMPIMRPRLDNGMANKNFAQIRILSKPQIQASKPRILRKNNPRAIPRFSTVNSLHTNVQPANVGIPGNAANNFIQQSNNSYARGFAATDNIQLSADTMRTETINKPFHSNYPVTENEVKVDDYAVKIENDGIQQMDTGNDDNKITELKRSDTDEDENDLIKIEFPTDENEGHLVKFEVEETKDDIESYCFFEESAAKRRKSETTDSDFKIVKLEIDDEHDYT